MRAWLVRRRIQRLRETRKKLPVSKDFDANRRRVIEIRKRLGPFDFDKHPSDKRGEQKLLQIDENEGNEYTGEWSENMMYGRG